jgi:hypothetical protein
VSRPPGAMSVWLHDLRNDELVLGPLSITRTATISEWQRDAFAAGLEVDNPAREGYLAGIKAKQARSTA